MESNQEKLKLFLTKLVKRGAVAVVALAVAKGLLTPDLQNEATELLVEYAIEGGVVVAGALWTWWDAQKTARAIQASERKVEVALQFPADSLKEEVELHVEREQRLKMELPVNPQARVRGSYDPATQRFFPDESAGRREDKL